MSPAISGSAVQPNRQTADGSVGPVPAEIVQGARRGGRAIGTMFFAFFGAAWLLNAYQLANGHGWLPIALVLAGALLLFAFALRILRERRGAMLALRHTAESQRMRRQFRAINALQWVAVIATVIVLHRSRLDVWIVPAIMLVVGLHFLPLARVFHYRPHLLTGAVLIATALLYPFASQGGPASPVGSLTAGITLWLAALWSLRPGDRCPP